MNTNTLVKKLKAKIEETKMGIHAEEFGRITEVSDSIVRISGLRGCALMEMLSFEVPHSPQAHYGMALSLEEDAIGAIVLDPTHALREGMRVTRLGKLLTMPVGDAYLGRVIDPLGRAVDGKGSIASTQEYPVERVAPGVITREPVNQPMQTGITAIDALIPIGRGQRELIIGDRQTGKTALAIDTILNQKGKGVVCIYVAIGQKKSKVAQTVALLQSRGAMEYTTVVVAGSSDPASFLYIAPYSSTALAEYFMDQGKDVVIVYDDLTKQAVAYRELSLLLRRSPGREAYPGDIFYLHSRLLERACRRNKEHGGGSITALPIIETQADDVTAYIPTNVISITDGQIFLESGLFHKGIRPAIHIGLSVSRVGGSAQPKALKKVAGRMKLAMAQYRELEAFSQFSSDLDPETTKQLQRGMRATELLKQEQFSPLPSGVQVAYIFALNEGYLDALPLKEVLTWQKKMREYLTVSRPDLLKTLETDWSTDIETDLRNTTETFMRTYGTTQ